MINNSKFKKINPADIAFDVNDYTQPLYMVKGLILVGYHPHNKSSKKLENYSRLFLYLPGVRQQVAELVYGAKSLEKYNNSVERWALETKKRIFKTMKRQIERAEAMIAEAEAVIALIEK